MRSFSSATRFVAAGALVWGCTVYDSGLVATNGELTGDAAGQSGTPSGGGSSSAGKASAAGSGARAGDAATGGSDTMPSDAGAPSDGGEASVEAGGTAGAAGAAGTGGTNASGSAGAGTGGSAGTAGTSGSGGSGGTASVVLCADHPLPLKTTWVATASSSSIGNGTEADGLYNPPEHMLDGSYTERWSSGKAQLGDEWIQIDFGVVVTLTDLTLNPGNDAGDYPRTYAVRMSNKDQDFAAAVKASGDGMPGTTFIHFAKPVTGRYVTVRQTAMPASAPWWTIAEVLADCTDP